MQGTFNSKLLFHEHINEECLLGLSVGYEMKRYREKELARLITDGLLDFVLTNEEKGQLNSANALEKIIDAARIIYSTEKYQKRGEFGEILLHIILRDYYNTLPAISKMYFKTSMNDTVKGFDAVHIVEDLEGNLEIWLGEVKFYNEINRAISDVVKELHIHSEADYLRKEFLLISNKLEKSWKHCDTLKDLIDNKTSLDKIFKKLKIPVLLTYDSSTIHDFDAVTEEYEEAITKELFHYASSFKKKDLPQAISIVLIMIPLKEKANLVEILNKRLKGLQDYD